MYNVAYRIVGDTLEAEDVLQEAFVSAFRKLDGYKGDATFGAWLKRIVVNMSINCLRRRRMALSDVEDYHNELAEPAQAERAEEQEWPWSVEQIYASIGQLPEGYKVVLTLYLVEGYDHAEIAQILGVSEATSKSQFHRARLKLQRMLCEQAGLSLSGQEIPRPAPLTH